MRGLAYLMAALELIVDKLPRVPNRTAPFGLAARGVCGAGVAHAMLRRRGRAARYGALALGAAIAVASAFTGLRLRRMLTRRLGGGALANGLAGALEDAALLASAAAWPAQPRRGDRGRS